MNFREGSKRVVIVLSSLAFVLALFIFSPELFNNFIAFNNSSISNLPCKYIPTSELIQKNSLKPWEKYELQQRLSSKLCEAIDSIRSLPFAFVFDSTKSLNEDFIENKISSGNFIDLKKDTLFRHLPVDSQKEKLFEVEWKNNQQQTISNAKVSHKNAVHSIIRGFFFIFLFTVSPWIVYLIILYIVNGFVKK